MAVRVGINGFGRIGRNVFRGPHFFNTDLGLAKNTRIGWAHLGEAANLELRANFSRRCQIARQDRRV